jgi:hypothetical protein
MRTEHTGYVFVSFLISAESVTGVHFTRLLVQGLFIIPFLDLALISLKLMSSSTCQ